MRKLVCLFTLLLVIFLTGCNGKVNSPALTAANMNFFARVDDVFYDDFADLFDKDNVEENFILNKFELVNSIKSDSSSIATLAFIRYDNSKALLVQFSHDIDTDKYLIYNVIEVPEEIAAFLKEEDCNLLI